MLSVRYAQGTLQDMTATPALFVAWLWQVQPDTLAGSLTQDITQPNRHHPLAIWLSCATRCEWTMRVAAHHQVIGECWVDDRVVEWGLMPPWAQALFPPVTQASLRITSGQCLALIGKEATR